MDNLDENTIPNYIEVYNYDSNGYYFGTDMAEKDPVEEGNYLLPANSTKEKPPIITEGKIQKWNGTAWDIVDIPKNITNQEINKSNNEEIDSLKDKIKEQQDKLDEYEKRIISLEQLVSGIIATNITVS